MFDDKVKDGMKMMVFFSSKAVLLNLMETGILSETKLKGKTRQRIVKVWVYATSNNVEKISTPLR